MAKIPNYEQRVGLPGGIDMPNASGANIGSGLISLGQSLTSAANDYNQVQRQKQEYTAKLNYLQDQNEMDAYLQEAKKTANPDGSGFTEQTVKKWNEIKQKRLDSSESGFQRQNYDLLYSNALGDYTHKANAYESQLFGQSTVNDLQSGIDTAKNQVRANPNLLQDKLMSTGQVLDVTPLDVSLKNKLKAQSEIDLYESALDGKVSALSASPNPSQGQIAALMSELKSDKAPWKSKTSPEKYDQSLSKLESMSRVASAVTTEESILGFEEEMNRVVRVGVDPSKYQEKYTEDFIKKLSVTPKRKESMLAMREQSLAKAYVKFKTQDVSFQEASKMYTEADFRKDANNDPSNFNVYKAKFDTVQDVLKQSKEEFKKDQIGYTRGIKPDFDDLVGNFEAKWDMDQVTPEEVKSYVSSVKQYQKQVDEYSTPRVVTKAQSDKLKYVIGSSSSSEKGATEMYAAVIKESQKWGGHWKDALKDLSADKVFNPTAEIASGVINNPMKHSFVESMFKASKLNDEELNKLYGNKISSDTLKQQVNASLNKFLASQKYTTDYDTTALKYIEGVTNGTKYFKGEKSPQEVADMVANDNYNFSEIGRNIIRVPKTEPITRSKISRVLPGVVSNILANPQDIFVPPSLYKGLKEEDKARMYASRIFSNGGFVNDGDSGLRLVDGEGNQVWKIEKNENGQKRYNPVKYNWKELDSLPTNELQNLNKLYIGK